jgi:two-component system, LuxR family, sensor kinase FixL
MMPTQTGRGTSVLYFGPFRGSEMNTTRDTLPALARLPAPADAGTMLRAGSRRACVGWSILFVVLYVGLDAASSVFPSGPIPVSPWNPQAGLAIALLFVGGRRFVPATLAAALLSEIIVREPGWASFDVVGGLAIGIGYVATGLVFRMFDEGRSIMRMAVLRDFLTIALVGTAASALAYTGAFALLTGGGRIVPAEVMRKWLGDYVGIVAFAPLLLTLLDTRIRRPTGHRLAVDVLLFGLGLLALLVLVFGIEPIEGHKLFYLLFLPLIYLAMRQDFPGAAIGVACGQFALIAALVVSERSADAATEYQLLMAVLAVTTLLLGSVASERRRALAELAQRSAELQAQQAALADAMRVAAASETASTLAHEMSQPLSAIGTYARAGVEMMRHGEPPYGEIRAVLERIERETARSSEVVRRVRDFFRTGVAHREPTDLHALLADAVAAVRDRLDRERIALAIEMPADLPDVDTDKIQIGTVLHNLLGNAIDALTGATSQRRIRIAVRGVADNEVEVDVEDSGPGIAEAVEKSLFEPLATTKPAGMGLGLTICRTIVQAHGGRLWLVSRQPALFRFTLPIHGHEHL